jgi:hypothetical protein
MAENKDLDLDFGFDFGGNEADFDFGEEFTDFDISFADDEKDRYITPKLRCFKQSTIKFENALELARAYKIQKGCRFDCFVSGKFIFGDYLEAYLGNYRIKVKKMTISTLSISQENVDSLANLLHWGLVDELNLVISSYFFAHERNGLIAYIYKELDIDNKFQLAVAGLHTKTTHFETYDSLKIVMHGSANLRSSASIEQFTIEENEEVYDFYDETFDALIEEYKTIRKPIIYNKAWDCISRKRFKD